MTEAFLKHFRPLSQATQAAYELRSRALHRELKKLSQFAIQNKFDLILLKGAALLLREYQGSLRRKMSDIDVLVRKEDVARLRTCLEREGYRPARSYSRNRWHEQILNDVENEGRVALTHARRLPLDLHWKISYWSDAERIYLDEEEFWKSASFSAYPRLHLPPPELHFRLLTLHAFEYGSPSPTQLLDLTVAYRPTKIDDPKFTPLLESISRFRKTKQVDGVLTKYLKQKYQRRNTIWLNLRRKRFRSLKTFLVYCLGYLIPEPSYYGALSVEERWYEHYLGRFLSRLGTAGKKGEAKTFPRTAATSPN